MKRKVYIETTVVSYYTGQPTRDLIIAARREETRALWPRLVDDYDSSISALVLTARLIHYWRTNMHDPIVDEVRANRMEHTRKFHGDLKLICEDLRKIQQEFSQRVVRDTPREILQPKSSSEHTHARQTG